MKQTLEDSGRHGRMSFPYSQFLLPTLQPFICPRWSLIHSQALTFYFLIFIMLILKVPWMQIHLMFFLRFCVQSSHVFRSLILLIVLTVIQLHEYWLVTQQKKYKYISSSMWDHSDPQLFSHTFLFCFLFFFAMFARWLSHTVKSSWLNWPFSPISNQSLSYLSVFVNSHAYKLMNHGNGLTGQHLKEILSRCSATWKVTVLLISK